MIRYADEAWSELKFKACSFQAERRNDQWVDVTIRVVTEPGTPIPDDVIDFSILAVCTFEGHPLMLAVLDEGCDSEYQLTEGEKEQLEAAIRSEEAQMAIAAAVRS